MPSAFHFTVFFPPDPPKLVQPQPENEIQQSHPLDTLLRGQSALMTND